MHRKRVRVLRALAGQRVGINEIDDRSWIVSFMHCDLGYIDAGQQTLQPLVPRSAQSCCPGLRCGLLPMSPVRTIRLLADGVGFEPTDRLHDRRISSPVHSTALPPIRRRRS